MELSILIPSVPSRIEKLQKLLAALEAQIGSQAVEILVLCDNKRRTIGRKRNELLTLAQGRYVTFVDDDDDLSADYLSVILSAIREHPVDAIFYQVRVFWRGTEKLCKYGADLKWAEDDKYHYRGPSHLSVYRLEVALACKFPDISWGEDREWRKLMSKAIQTHHSIDNVLYTYYCEERPLSWYVEKRDIPQVQ